EVEARVFAHLAAEDDALAALLGPVPAAYRDDRSWRAGAYYTLLWSRGVALRSSSLRPYNPYVLFPPTDRALLLNALPARGAVVEAQSEGWRARLEESLSRHGVAYLGAQDA